MEKRNLQFILIILLWLFSNNNYAQSNDNLEWILLQTEGAISLYRAYTVQDDMPVILLKVKNSSRNNYEVSWESQFTLVDNKIIDIDKSFTVQISAQETLLGTTAGDELSLNPFNYVTTLEKGVSDYTIKNLNIIEY